MIEEDKNTLLVKELTANKKTKKRKKKKTAASSKSVETMFRNAYRAQLDMIALAATKANIMISLNGVIVSILMVTGGFIYANQPAFLLPAILFLITSAISIYFALSAASPSPAPAHTRVFCCFRDILKRKATLSDLKDYINAPEKRFGKDTSNILIFEDFAKLPKDVYLKEMAKLVKNPEKTYEKMSDQLYWLGLMADKKFSNLRYSYSVFRWGLILSILAFSERRHSGGCGQYLGGCRCCCPPGHIAGKAEGPSAVLADYVRDNSGADADFATRGFNPG